MFIGSVCVTAILMYGDIILHLCVMEDNKVMGYNKDIVIHL